MLIAANVPKQSKPSLRLDATMHLFKLGQAVRLKGGMWPSGNVYLITAKLPPSGDSPQYRIRNDTEKFERMATQANLELAIQSADGESIVALEKSFGVG